MRVLHNRHQAMRLALLLSLCVAAAPDVAARGARGVSRAGSGSIRYAPGAGAARNLPYGARRTLPYGVRNYGYQGRPYYWYSGGWYAPAYYGMDLYYYPVIEPVPGVVGSVPIPYQIVHRGNAVYYVSGGVWYQPFMYLNTVFYRVVAVPGQY
jgi:hypothetical protein